MKTLCKIGACAVLAAGVATSVFGQIQTAGTLQVSLDAVSLPVGPISFLNNPAAAGGIFQSHTNNANAVGPQVIAVGGNGTHGVLFDGECELAQEDGAGNPLMAPGNLTMASFTGFSVEAWVFAPMLIDDNPVVSWGTRGNCTPNQISCAYGSSAAYGGLAMWCNDHGWGAGGTPPAGSWHHLAWTLDTSGNENLYADGVLKATYTGVTPNADANNNILIGASHANTGGSLVGALTGGEIVGRVRIMDGILSSLQVSNNYAYEVATFTNGTPTFLTAQPLHRYSFINAATNDAVGLTVPDRGTASNTVKAVNAVVKGVYGGATAQFTGSALTLAGGSAVSAPYVDLTNAMVTPFSTNNGGSGTVTYEAWVSFAAPNTANNWGRVWDFGDNTFGQFTNVNAGSYSYTGTNYVALVGVPGTDANNANFGFLSEGMYFKSHVIGSLTHIAVTWNDTNQTINVYENGVQITTLVVTNRMAGIQDVNNWLGRSNWSPDNNMAGNFYEFRVFNRIVTPQELLNDYQVGPTVTGSVLKWNGNVSGNWDINNTPNWLAGATPVKYNDGGTVQFDDTLTGTTNVNLTTVVQPATLIVNNSITNYIFGGSGSISGGVGLTKSGTASLTLNNQNNYTGITALNAGTVIVTNLANGGSPSAIGAAPAAAANLAFAGGTLSYRGPATSINRGYAVSANSTLDVQGDLTISGAIAATAGTFTKSGAAKLTITGTGVNKLSNGGGGQALGVANGTLVLDGSAGQTNVVSGETWVGFDQAHSATMIFTNVAMTNTSWFAVGRGNGTNGFTSTAMLYNSRYNVGNLSLGFRNSIAGNNQTVSLTLNGTSKLIDAAVFNLSESTGSVSTVTMKDSSAITTAGALKLGLEGGAIGNLVMMNNATWTNTSFTSIGAPGNGNMTLQDNAVYQDLGDFNVTDTPGTAALPSVSTLNISNNAMLIINTLYLGKSTNCYGTINQAGGTVIRNAGNDWHIGGNQNLGAAWAPVQVGIWNFSGGLLTCNANFQVGAYGTGYFNQSGGTANLTGGYPDFGRYVGGVGYLSVSGGNFNQLGTGNILLIGEAGTGTLNVSGTGTVTCYGSTTGLGLGWTSTGNGTLNLTNGSVNVTNNVVLGNAAGGVAVANLYGGTLAASRILTGNAGASSTLNFYGGTLKAMPNANPNFLSGLSSATIYSGGAKIDSGTNVITITQDLNDGGSGNLTKLGTGTLTLSGNQYYSGSLTVSQGTVTIPSGMTFAPTSLSVADGAALGLQVATGGGQVNGASLSATLGVTTGSTLNINLGSFGNASAAPLNVGGTLTKNGTTTVNVSGTGLPIGPCTLVKYGTLAGAGNFVIGSLPPGVVGNIVTNLSNSSIDLNVTAVNILLWTGVNNNGAWDTSSINWTNILNLLPAAYSQGSSVVFDDSVAAANGTNGVNVTTTMTPSSVAFSNNAVAYKLVGSGKLSGTTGVGLYGTGAVTLSTTNNNYSGATVVTGGSLSAGVSNALSANSSVLLQNAALNITNNQAVKSLTASNAVVGGAAGTLTGAGFSLENTPVNVPLAGTGALIAVGTNINTELVTLLNNNTYSGQTVIGGGTLSVTNLANSGGPSSIGASSASPTNLVFAGGTLAYQGTGASIDRGYTITANSVLDTEGNLSLGGQVAASGGTFAKTGPATLTINGAKLNQLSAGGGGRALGIANGTMVLDGTAGQTNTVTGETWVGYDQAHNATLILTNTVLTNTSWFAVGRGNGAGGYTSTATLYNSTISANQVSFGYDAGVAGNNQNVVVTLTNNSRLINTGGSFNFTESAGSSSTLAIYDTSWLYSASRILIGMANGSTGTVVVAGSGAITNGGWVSIGDPGTGMATLKNNAVWQMANDFNVTDVGANSATPSSGTLNVQDNASLLIYTLYVGKGSEAGREAGGSYCNGTVNQSGGTVLGLGGGDWRIGGNNTTNGDFDGTVFGTYNLSGGYVHPTANLQVGSGGTGEWYQTGGTAVVSGYPSIGRYGSSIGQLDISAGSFSQTNVAAYMVVGESGQGTLNLSGTGLVYAAGGIDIGQNSGAVGTVNLNGGTLSVSRVFQGNSGASGTFYFNGGLLQALPGSYPSFMAGLSAAYVEAGGANIDSGANNITIAQSLQDNGGGGLVKLGSGKLILAGANTYSGLTTVSNGTLAVDGVVAGAVSVVGGTLGGTGEIDGLVTVGPLGTLAPGNSIGTLTNLNTMTLQGATVMEISRNSGVLTSDSVVGLTQVNYGGSLTVNNVGPDQLHVGDAFQLFSAGTYAGSFAAISLPTPYIWATNLAAGIIQVTGLGVATNPTNITAVVVGGNLQLSWPADHKGWRLESQTNTVAVGLNNNWVPVAGSSATNQVNVPINSANGSVFFRLIYP